MLRRTLFTVVLGVGFLLLSGPLVVAGPHPPRNVIVVMPDDQGYGDLGCTGNPLLKTPELDRLHDQSIRLEDFHVDPSCSPTRAALMTGRYSTRVGVWHTIAGRSLLRPGERTMAEVFKAGGYRTAIFGKWHLGDNWPLRPEDRGFEEVFTHGGGGIGQTPDRWGNGYFDPVLNHNGQAVQTRGFCTDVFTDAAMQWIEAHRDERLFIYLPFNACHAPYAAPPQDVKPFLDRHVNKELATFYGMVANIDRNVGRLRAKLAELKLEDDTLLIFLTDNGTSGTGFNAGMRGRKGSEYEGGHRVPCFIHWPAGGLGPARSVTALTSHIDLLPTLIDLCGLAAPAGVAFDGTDLAPLLRNPGATPPNRSVFVEVNRVEEPQPWARSAVMNGPWRLVNGKELYDLRSDPGQTKDIAADHPEVVAKLRGDYQRWWDSLGGSLGQTVRIELGDDHANPARLTAHDWHSEQVPWNQQMIRRGVRCNGWWAVNVAKAGRYRFTLRQQPAEAAHVLQAARARLRIGEVEAGVDVPPGATSVQITAEVSAGPAKLQTWLEGEGKPRGAYFVEVERLR